MLNWSRSLVNGKFWGTCCHCLLTKRCVSPWRQSQLYLRLLAFFQHITNNMVTWLTNQVNNQSLIPSTDMIQLTLILKMTTAQVVETSVNNNSPIQDYVHLDDHNQPTHDGSCLLWVMSTEISVDIAVDTRSIVVDTRSIANLSQSCILLDETSWSLYCQIFLHVL